MKPIFAALLAVCATSLPADELASSPAPVQDRVGFPKDYQANYRVLRTVIKKEEFKVVTIYGNQAAASVTNAAQLPYPYGSIIVMETATTLKDQEGKAVSDNQGGLRRDQITGLHVMRREKGFGEAYGRNRSGEWEFVEYRPDGSQITPPAKSAACAECHVKAGSAKDFVYHGRFAETKK